LIIPLSSQIKIFTTKQIDDFRFQFVEGLVPDDRQTHDVGRVPLLVEVEKLLPDVDPQSLGFVLEGLDVAGAELEEVVFRVGQRVFDLKDNPLLNHRD
jgi:hypothetical protein